MAFHRCTCTFIPPDVLDNLARRGDPAVRQRARASAQQAKISRDRRAAHVVPMAPFVAGTPLAGPAGVAPPLAATASRETYDCQTQWVQRVALVRGEGAPATGDSAADAAYDNAGIVRDFFQNELGRNSIDNAGMTLILNVHYGVDYLNAFWDGDEMTFGDGDGNIFSGFAQSLDVVAHELAHGVTQYTANLDYFSQSGALNEHFSDVFGSVITQAHLGQDAGTADWLIGDEIMGPTLFGEALRSMKAPGTAYDNALLGQDPQPDHMSNYYAGPGDNQGVHINSGIPNKAFYLVASDIGTPTAGKIWYHALQNLWYNANFAEAVDVIVESARILTKNGEAPLGSTQVVRMAFKAVGL